MSLDRLLGVWDFEMQHVHVPELVRGSHEYEQVLDGAFVLLRWTYAHPEFPDAQAFLEETRFHYFDVRGITRTFDLVVDDAGWSMIRRDADFWQRISTRFVGDDAMEGDSDLSHDQGATWEHDFDIRYTRRG